MHSKRLMLASLVWLWSCSGDEKAGATGGGAGAESAGSAGRAQADAGGSGGESGENAAGHGGLATGGTTMGGAAGVAGGSANFGGTSGAGLGGAAAGAGGASDRDENPYGACIGEDATENSCPLPGSICHADFGCQPPCPSGTVSCALPPSGGTAKPYCQQRLCRLDCGFGKTCPTGMVCDTSSAFCSSNRL